VIEYHCVVALHRPTVLDPYESKLYSHMWQEAERDRHGSYKGVIIVVTWQD
jgi:hypothetical protein